MENKGFEGEGSQEGGGTNHVIDSSQTDLSTKVDLPAEKTMPDKPYPGMTKEELLRFSDTPFWNRLRLVSFIVFWLGWLALLVSVVVLTITSSRCGEAPEPSWWQKTSMYQIYVRSFYDSNGDGVGDLTGIVEKMDYLDSLNVGAIILSSFYQSEHTDANSPDYGYEVTDHTAIEAVYGTETDFTALIEEAHRRGIRVIIDFIPNHTGLDHPWYVAWESGTDPDSDSVYTSAECGTASNWVSVYGGSAWQDRGDGTCYLHQLLVTQPELNLRNSVVRERLDDVLRYWLELGVDGFRVVNAKYLVEDFDQRDEEPVPGCTDTGDYNCWYHTRTASQDENFDLLSRWRAVVESYSGDDNQKILLADVKETVNNTVLYYGNSESDSANLPLNYGLIQAMQDVTCGGQCVADYLEEFLDKKPSYATSDWMLSHQDESRLSTQRMGDDYARALNILRMTLPGPSFAYYGEEIGMIDGNPAEWGCRDPGFENSTRMLPCRDRSRTPMQWNDSPGGGFSTNDSWIPVNDDYMTINVANLDNPDDEFSTLEQFRKLAELKNDSTALQYGEFHLVHVDENIVSFTRAYEGTDRLLIIVNLGTSSGPVDYPDSSPSDLSIPGEAEVWLVSGGGLDFVAGDTISLWELEITPGNGVVFVWPYSR